MSTAAPSTPIPSAEISEQNAPPPGPPAGKPTGAHGVARLLTRDDLSQALGVSTRQLSRLIALRDVPPPTVTLGRSPRWSREAIDNWLADAELRQRTGRRPRRRKGGGA